MNNKSIKDVQQACLVGNHGDLTGSRLCIINHEFNEGFKFMKKYPKSVTIFGSARLPEDNIHSKNATAVAKAISEKGYSIVTGGGNGIMGAGNKGAFLAGGDSLGLNIELPFEQQENSYLTDSMEFHHFFSRKVTLAYSAEAYIYFAGGFGTLDELFEILTMKQTKKIPDVPVILFGSEFWKPLEEYFKNSMLEYTQTINPEDLNLYVITDDIDEVVRIVTESPIRDEVSDRSEEYFK